MGEVMRKWILWWHWWLRRKWKRICKKCESFHFRRFGIFINSPRTVIPLASAWVSARWWCHVLLRIYIIGRIWSDYPRNGWGWLKGIDHSALLLLLVGPLNRFISSTCQADRHWARWNIQRFTVGDTWHAIMEENEDEEVEERQSKSRAIELFVIPLPHQSEGSSRQLSGWWIVSVDVRLSDDDNINPDRATTADPVTLLLQIFIPIAQSHPASQGTGEQLRSSSVPTCPHVLLRSKRRWWGRTVHRRAWIMTARSFASRCRRRRRLERCSPSMLLLISYSSVVVIKMSGIERRNFRGIEEEVEERIWSFRERIKSFPIGT